MAEFFESPCSLVQVKRAGSSPPSPVLDLPPIRFIAIASVSCASCEMEPYDIAPVLKRRMMASADSTSSSGTGVGAFLNSSRLRSVQCARPWSLISRA